MRTAYFWSGAALAFAIVACTAKAKESSHLQAIDTADTELDFDPNGLIELNSLQDSLSFDSAAIQRFLAKTPYKRPSFLEVYQSNGVRAADAVHRASVQHRINPLVILARAEMEQGLIGLQFYPDQPARVEYVFSCGCPGAGSKCDPAMAGFDRQADCFARTLRAHLDDLRERGRTAGGWAANQEAVTLDGKKITPLDDATAVLYQYTPIVGQNRTGNWLLWNIYQQYVLFTEYEGPSRAASGSGAWIGEACAQDQDCVAEESFCATNFPGGLCTTPCEEECPTLPGRGDSFCAEFGDDKGGYCLPTCNPGIEKTCRDNYECKPVFLRGTKETQNACVRKQ